jgi:hypothetical protein
MSKFVFNSLPQDDDIRNDRTRQRRMQSRPRLECPEGRIAMSVFVANGRRTRSASESTYHAKPHPTTHLVP